MRISWFLAIVGGLGCAILLSLGVWQLKRLGAKNEMLAEIHASISADPVALPAGVEPGADSFLAVTVAGQMEPGEVHIWTAFKGIGAGYRVIAPFQTAEQGRILVDRGFVPATDKLAARPLGAMALVGNLHWPNETDSFTPPPDHQGRVWYARDVDQMAAELDTRPVLLVLRETPPGSEAIRPMPITTAGIPNDHLQYAITWFSLALIWAGMTVYFQRRTGTQPKGSN